MDKGNQRGIYCTYCGKWLKWADKDEQNLAMKQEPIIDKIRAEIEEVYMNITYQENKDRKATWGLRKALQIIDKYKAETEGKA